MLDFEKEIAIHQNKRIFKAKPSRCTFYFPIVGAARPISVIRWNNAHYRVRHLKYRTAAAAADAEKQP